MERLLSGSFATGKGISILSGRAVMYDSEFTEHSERADELSRQAVDADFILCTFTLGACGDGY